MRELASQSANDVLTSNDRLEIQKEVNQLKDELNRIANGTEFNTKRLLDGSQTALISSNSDAVNGIVTGGVEGNGDFDVSIALLRGGISQMSRSQIFTLNDGSGKLADGSTQLQSIAQFYNSDGVFALETSQTLTLTGNGDGAEVTVDGLMTLDNLAANLQNALASKSGLSIESSRGAVVNTVQTQVAGVGGYIELTSGFIGDQGKFSFASEQSVMDALGFSVQRDAVNSRVEVVAKDSFGNTSSVQVEGSNAANLLDGIDVQFASQSGQVAGTKGLEQGLRFTSNQTFIISANETSGRVTLTYSATHGYSMAGIARALNDQLDGIAGLENVDASIVDGEVRLSFNKPASAAASIANTITIVSAATTALSIGFSDGTYSGFVDGKKNQDEVVWGFSRYASQSEYAFAPGAVTFDISDGNGTESITIMDTIDSTSMTVADLVRFTRLQASVNNLLDTATVEVRLDQVGSSLAFTALNVGTNNGNTDTYTSMVSLTNLAAGTDSLMLGKLGVAEGTSKGSGDTNFKLHIVNNQPQFQIGADQGQTMDINISNMSARALGVGNLDLTNVDGANEAMGRLDKAIDMVSAERSKLGSYENRLEYSINNLRNTHSNLLSAESRIRDTDIALEMIEFTKLQIGSQAGTAMLAQANMIPQGVLDLLGS
jgi:flagellin